MPLKAFVRIHCSRCGELQNIKMHDDGIHVKSDSHRCPKWKPEMGPPDPPRSFYMNQAVIFPDDKEEWDKIQAEKEPDSPKVIPKIHSIIVIHENGTSVIKAENLLEMEEYINQLIEEYESIIVDRFDNGLDHPPKTQPCPICDTPLETPGRYFMALGKLRENNISYGKLAIENEKQLKKDGDI